MNITVARHHAKPLESVKQFAVRIKATIDVFDITEPQGTL